jgi:predicted transcriptional regulator
MIIRVIASSGSIEIDEPHNFRAFSVRIEGAFDAPTAETALLGRIAVRSDHDHAWISEKSLREWPELAAEPWWQDGLSKMIATVEKFGWIDAAEHAIRAHIERTL